MTPRLRRITAAARLPLTVDQVSDFLGIDRSSTFHDDLLKNIIASVTDEVERAIARSLIATTWELALPGFPRVIEIPLPPTISVASIVYFDKDGDEVTLDPATYRVSGINSEDSAEIEPAYATAWPATEHDNREAVRVRFVAGYGTNRAAVPPSLIAAMLDIVADRFALRGSVLTGAHVETIPNSARDVLTSFRSRWAF
jgi:uncharacterized phiE125 gp8 family phage protein